MFAKSARRLQTNYLVLSLLVNQGHDKAKIAFVKKYLQKLIAVGQPETINPLPFDEVS